MPEEAVNLAKYLFERARQTGRWQETAIFFADEEISYEDLHRRSRQCIGLLQSLGIRPGDRVALVLGDCPQFITAFLGITGMGAIAVPINTALSPADLSYILRNCGARALVLSDEQLDKFETISVELKDVTTVLLVGGRSPGRIAFDPGLAAAEEAPFASTRGDQPAFFLYTSGSTGRPKGAVHLHRSVPFTVETYCRRVLDVRPDDRLFSVARLFFAYGLGNSLSFPLGSGAAVVLSMEKQTPETIAEVLRRYRPTIFFAVPSVFRALLQYCDQGKTLDTGSLRFCVSAAETLPPWLFHQWKSTFGLDIIEGIGTTEMLHIFISNDREEVRPGSSGRCVPGYEVKLLAETGEDVTGEGVGHLVVHGDSALAEYWHLPEKTRATVQQGWVRTGDVYRRDDDEFYWFQGRSDEMFKVKGLWVSPIEVEEALSTHPDVSDVAVIPGTDPDGMMTAVAYVVPHSMPGEPDLLAETLKAHALAALPRFKCPSEVRFIEQLPRTVTGKTQRFKLRELYHQAPAPKPD